MTVKEDAAGAPVRNRFGVAEPFGRLFYIWLVTVAFLSPAVTWAVRLGLQGTESYFLIHQDLPVLGLILLIVASLGALAPATPILAGGLSQTSMRRLVLALAALVTIAGVVGVWAVFGGYTLSLDEFMADFDARIFASGQLMARIPAAWRDYVPALQPMFTLPVPDHSVWASSYLPVNAALRALGLEAHVEFLVNPLLSAFSVVAVWAIGRRLWPERPGLALIAAALLATSAQLIVMGMTAYAMPPHLAFNLAWLWLFLRGGRLGHLGAGAVAFLAMGIHQLVFHPLFAGPFVLQLWLDRRWTLAALYTGAYAVFALFWIAYWPAAMTLTGVGLSAVHTTGPVLFFGIVRQVLGSVSFVNLGEMAQSLVRFVTWQNPLTVPLAILGAVAAWRAGGTLRALIFGVVLLLAAMLVIEPTQVHGWGYRYMHGFLGSVCLIAAWTWAKVTDALAPEARAKSASALALACALSLVGLTPLRAWQAWSYVRPYARANALIQGAKADVVIIDHDSDILFDMGTVTRNDPLLQTPPKVMALAAMNEATVRRLCASGLRISIFDGRDAAAEGIDVVRNATPSRYAARLRDLMAQLKCGSPIS